MTWRRRGPQCPCCGIFELPEYRALCPFCFTSVPAPLRSDFIRAFHLRTQDPVAYQEQLVRLLTWRNETHAGLWGKGEKW